LAGAGKKEFAKLKKLEVIEGSDSSEESFVNEKQLKSSMIEVVNVDDGNHCEVDEIKVIGKSRSEFVKGVKHYKDKDPDLSDTNEDDIFDDSPGVQAIRQ